MSSKRVVSTLNEAALLSGNVKIVVFARLDFASGVQRFHTEIGPRVAEHPIYGSETYTGLGDFGGIASQLRETTSGAPQPLTIALTGVSPTLINLALTDDYFRREAEIMLGLEDTNGDLIDNPEILYSGYMDKVESTLAQNSAQLTMALESRGTQFLRDSDWRFTDEDLQVEYPGDLMGEYIYAMTDLVLRWGATTQYGIGPGRAPRDSQFER